MNKTTFVSENTFDSTLNLNNFNINFNSIDYILDFIQFTKDFEEWETQIFRLTASNGIQINIDTSISNTGFKEYTEFKKLKKILIDFYIQNKNISINMELKFKLPNSLKLTIDPDDLYTSFHLNCYSDQLLSYMTVSFIEKDVLMPTEPVKNWFSYIINLYDQWTKSKSF